MNCHRDSNALKSVNIPSWNLYNCPSCDGYLLNPLKKQITSKLISSNVFSSNLSCPECLSKMEAVVFKDIEIDICSKCNWIWLDKGEIYKIEKHVDKKEFYKGNGNVSFMISELLSGLLFLG
jgi:Zn-finger nucleic acid-binding protein